MYIPNGQRICQTFPFQGPPKFTQIGIFGLKIYHLATLLETQILFHCIKYSRRCRAGIHERMGATVSSPAEKLDLANGSLQQGDQMFPGNTSLWKIA
jgi:hypothetical protein